MRSVTAEAVPAGIYEALVRSLYDNMSTLGAGAVFGTYAVASVAISSASPEMHVMACILGAVGLGRIALSVVFRRIHPSTRTGGHALRPWRLAYAIGADAFSLAFGLACLIGMLRLPDPVSHMVLVTAAVGYAAGIAGRNSGCLEVSLSQLWCALAPIILGFALHGGSGYGVMMVTCLAFALAMSRISLGLNRSLLEAYQLAEERRALAARLDSAVSTMRHGFSVFGPDGRLEICSEALAR
jgi:PAS domain-containing protein